MVFSVLTSSEKFICWIFSSLFSPSHLFFLDPPVADLLAMYDCRDRLLERAFFLSFLSR